MAKSDSFFVRKTLNLTADNVYREAEIDLGFAIDALGKSVARIHNVAVTFADDNGRALEVSAQTSAAAQFQLTTQSQVSIVTPSDKALISSGKVYGYNQLASVNYPIISHDADVLPQEWRNGYLVAVESLYLGAQASSTWTTDLTVSIVIEMTSETMSQAASMALALSQQ